MNTESVMLFGDALDRGDDAFALSLLDNGRVTIQSTYISEHAIDGVRISVPIVFLAVRFVREQVVEVLVRLGAGIDSFRERGGGSFITPAGDAVLEGNVPALSLCLRLDANLKCVYRTVESPPILFSGLGLAIGQAMHGPLIHLLDEVYTARPVRLGEDEVGALVAMANRGSPAKVCYKIFESRGFKIKGLEETRGSPSDEIPGVTSLADTMLSHAQNSGAADLMRYLVKSLGLESTAERMESAEKVLDKQYAECYGDGVSPPRGDFVGPGAQLRREER